MCKNKNVLMSPTLTFDLEYKKNQNCIWKNIVYIYFTLPFLNKKIFYDVSFDVLVYRIILYLCKN